MEAPHLNPLPFAWERPIQARRARAIASNRAMRLAAFLQVVLMIFFHSPETTRTEHSFLRLHANTMKRLDHTRNQMLVGNHCLTWKPRSHFHIKSNSGRLRSLPLQMP